MESLYLSWSHSMLLSILKHHGVFSLRVWYRRVRMIGSKTRRRMRRRGGEARAGERRRIEATAMVRSLVMWIYIGLL